VFSPLYPFLTAALHTVTGDYEMAAHTVSLVLETFVILPIGHLGKKFIG
jgi:hypothetical protein